MEQIYNWILANWQMLLLIINTAVLLVSYIVKLTPTQADDNFLARVIDFLKKISVYKEQQ